MLKSKARSRIALRAAAAAGVVSAATLLAGLPLFHASADTKTVSYSCAATGTPQTPSLIVTLTAPVNATLNQAFALTWTHATAAAPAVALTATAEIQTTDRLVITGDIILSGPGAAATVTVHATNTGTPNALIPVGSAIPIPALTASVTPNATGTISAKADKFTLAIGPASGGATTTYTCTIAGASTAPATAAVVVTSGSTSTTTSPSPSASGSTHTPVGTRTVFVTETAPTPGSTTPAGGAATGGGGDLGPDGRVLVFSGLALVLAATLGGLLMRARRGGATQE